MSNVYTVSSASELYAALNNATGGETIRMVGGDYGNLNFKYVDLDFDAPVTITSVDPNNQAIISEMTLNGARNVTFEEITFKSYYTASVLWYQPFSVHNSEDITFDNVLFEGTPAKGISAEEDGTGRAKGLFVEKSTDITVTDSEFAMWYRGMLFSEVENLTVTGNDVHSIRSDGMTLGAIQTSLIEGNYIHDFITVPSSGDHADMIQLMNLGNVTSSDMVFRGNTFDIGSGGTTQTLFMRNQIVDQSGKGIDNFYQNITIEENVILNGHAHGITVGETNNLVVRNNTVLSIRSDDPEYSSTPYITVAGESRNVVIEQNVSQAISGYDGQADWQVRDNVLVQNTDPQGAGYYKNEFITSTLDDESANALTVRSDSTIADNGAGATRMLSGQSDSAIEPLFNLYSVEHDLQTIFFDARETSEGSAGPLPDGTEFHWDFGDGATATGIAVQHSYAYPGEYVASLTVVTSDGATYAEMTGVEIAGNAVLSMDMLTGDFLQHYFDERTDIRNAKAVVENASGGEKVLAIGQSTGVSSIPKEALARFFGADNLELSMTLKADLVGTSYGEIARIHNSFYLKANADGNLDFILVLDTGVVRATTTGVRINDGALHDIVITLDGEVDVLNIVVDGNQVASVSAEGNVGAMAYWDMTIGNGWGKQTFEGQVGNLKLDVEAYDYPKIPNSEIPSASDLNYYMASLGTGSETGIETEEAPSDTATPDAGSIDIASLNTGSETGVKVEETPSGTASPDAGSIDEMTTTILSLNPLTGNFQRHGPDETATIEDAKVYVGDASTGSKTMDIGNDTGVSYVAKEFLAPFFETDFFEMSITLKADQAGESYGEIARIHDSFILKTDADGDLNLVLFLDSGAIGVTTTGVALNDGEGHDISVVFDNKMDLLTIDVDGQEAASVTAEGNMKEMAHWDLTFGNPWGKKHNFDGEISNFQIEVANIAPPLPPAVSSFLVNGMETSEPASYGGVSQDAGEAIVGADGSSVSLTNNAWKSVALDQTITADTVLSFEFKADVVGEIHGIGLDTDDAISEDRTFQLAGDQVWGIQGENGGYDVGGGWQQFDIRVGDYFTGDFDRLVFTMDDDAGVGADSAFRNVKISAVAPPPPPAASPFLVNGVETSEPASYGGVSQDAGEAVVSADGSSVSLTNNAWKSVALDQTITADTVLSFEFKADVMGEIHGIGLDTDDAISEDRTFQLAGDQVWGIQGENGGYDVGGGWQQFDIRVGDYFTGDFDRLVFTMDDDAGVGADSAFRNVKISDESDLFLF